MSGDYTISIRGMTADGPLQFAALEAPISADRLGTYLSEAAGDRALVRELFIWDRDVSAAMFADIAIVEVDLRQCDPRALTAQYGERWYELGGRPDWHAATAQDGYLACVRLANMIDFNLTDWFRSNSRVPSLLANRPDKLVMQKPWKSSVNTPKRPGRIASRSSTHSPTNTRKHERCGTVHNEPRK